MLDAGTVLNKVGMVPSELGETDNAKQCGENKAGGIRLASLRLDAILFSTVEGA